MLVLAHPCSKIMVMVGISQRLSLRRCQVPIRMSIRKAQDRIMAIPNLVKHILPIRMVLTHLLQRTRITPQGYQTPQYSVAPPPAPIHGYNDPSQDYSQQGFGGQYQPMAQNMYTSPHPEHSVPSKCSETCQSNKQIILPQELSMVRATASSLPTPKITLSKGHRLRRGPKNT
jgi:hypothetical protein